VAPALLADCAPTLMTFPSLVKFYKSRALDSVFAPKFGAWMLELRDRENSRFSLLKVVIYLRFQLMDLRYFIRVP
jgi:hypothetical protein